MQPEKLLKDYVASIEVPNSVKPDAVRDMILQDNELTAGTFLKSLRQLKISGSEFLDLLGNSRIGNSEYRYIEENPHLRFDELLTVLDNSVLTSEDYRVLLAAATHRKKLRDERRRREEEAVARLERDRAMAQKTVAEAEPVEEVPVEATPVEEVPAEETPAEGVLAEITPAGAISVEEAIAEETLALTDIISEVNNMLVGAPAIEVAPVETALAAEITAEETPTEEVPAEETPAEIVSADTAPAPTDIISEISDMLVGAHAVEEEPVEEIPADVTPTEKTPVEAALADEKPAEITPTEEIPAGAALVDAVPADEEPAEELPAEETPAEGVPAEITPAGAISVEEAIAEKTLVLTDIISEVNNMLVGAPAVEEEPELVTETATAEVTTTEEIPAGAAPVYTVPADEEPAEEVPTEEIPTEEVPVEEPLTEENPAPTDIISEISDMFAGAPAVEGEPTEATPTEEVPVEEIPVEKTPAEETPAEETPAEGVPAEITPAGAISVEEAIAEETLAPTDIISEISDMLVGAPAIEEVPAPVTETAMAEETPVEITQAEEVPAEVTPIEETHAEETPTEKASSKDTHEVQATAEQPHVEEAHKEQAPAKDVSEESEEDWEYEVYENDSLYDDDDYSAKSLARSVGELVEKREGRAKNCLIAAFSLAAAVLVFGVGFKLLKFYQVLPTYTYEIPAAPEEFSQQITNDKELLECARTPDEAVSYLSTAESPARAEHTYEQSKTAFSPKYVLRVCDNGKGKLVIKGGSINDKGKVESKFTADVFDDDITDLNIFYKEYDGKGYFILTAPAEDETCVKIYEQDALRQLDAPTVDYRQSGAMLDYYMGEDAFYPISYIGFDVDKANSGKPETFVPHIYNNDRSRAAAFNDIVLPYAAARLNYYVVSRLPFNGGNDCFVKASAVGENSGWAISSAGLYTSDTVKVNGDTHTRLTRICFDKSLTPSQYDLDGAVYPEMIAAGKTKLAVLGKGAENTSVLYVLPAALSEPSAVDNIAENKPTADIFCEGDILSVITAEEKPMQYSFDLNTLKSCEPIDNSLIFIKDGLYAKTEVKDKGVTLSVCIDKNTELASVDISEEGGSGYRLPSNADAVVTGISGDNVIIGVPVVYYDGVTDVGKFQFYTYKDKKLSPLGEIIVMEGDLSHITGAVTDGGYIVTVWGSRVITADSAKLKIISDASL